MNYSNHLKKLFHSFIRLFFFQFSNRFIECINNIMYVLFYLLILISKYFRIRLYFVCSHSIHEIFFCVTWNRFFYFFIDLWCLLKSFLFLFLLAFASFEADPFVEYNLKPGFQIEWSNQSILYLVVYFNLFSSFQFLSYEKESNLGRTTHREPFW